MRASEVEHRSASIYIMVNSGFISQLSAAVENVLLWLLNCERFCLAALLGVVYATVPNHPGKDIPPGTLRNIEKQLEPALGKGWATK